MRHVPIIVDPGYPSTSTPIETGAKLSRVHAIPINVKHTKENGSFTPGRKPRMHTPVHSLSQVVYDDDDDEPEVSII